jgi:8-oxo-dGTP pyrophosphatase MutT (NUDIX family)
MARARARAHQERSAGGIVYRIEAGVPVFLLIRDSHRNWGFPKGHLEGEEHAEAAAVREVAEETGLAIRDVRGEVETIDWYFRLHGRLIHKVCAFFLMESADGEPSPQHDEGITACRWLPYDEAARLVSYENARRVLERAHAMVVARRTGT